MESANKLPALTKTFQLLKYTFGVVPIVAGADKFTNILTQWDQYINPTIAGLLPLSSSVFMGIVGVVEIVAGIIVLRNPRLGGYIVSAWLTIIALTLLLDFSYVDVAVRDLVMAISALAMARMSEVVE